MWKILANRAPTSLIVAHTRHVHTGSVLGTWGNVHTVPKRNRRANRTVDPKWRAGRNSKILKVDLPDVELQRRILRENVSPEEMRAIMKKEGKFPPVDDTERPKYIGCTAAIIDPYIPREGDGKASLFSKEGMMGVGKSVEGKGRSMLSVRKIRKYEPDFSVSTFGDMATEIYIAAHNALANKNLKELHNLATEKTFPEMVHNINKQTLHWSYLKSLEPARVMRLRVLDVLAKGNTFAQVTVRFHSQQTLAVYDRFGRLIHGSPHVAKDVLEYAVFEKHVVNIYGAWRIHGKIIPEWAPARSPSRLTYVQELSKAEDTLDEEEDKPEAEQKETEDENILYDRYGNVVKEK